jgi:hypothetical protein
MHYYHVVDYYQDERDHDGGIEWWSTTEQPTKQEKAMGLVFKGSNSGTDFAPLAAGSHAARCFAVIDLGTQKTEYMGETKFGPRVRISWEVCGERMTDGRPMIISREYKASLHEKSQLRKDLEGWRGKSFTEAELAGFEGKQLLGKTCLLSVMHATRDGKTYANVAAISGLPKGMEAPKAENETLFLDLENFDESVFQKLSKYVQATIEKSPEFAAGGSVSKQSDQPDAFDDEEIPF